MFIGVAGQNVTEGPELQPAPVLPGNDTTWFRPNPFGFFPNFQWPFTRIFRCRFVHRSHPLIPYRESGTELPESSSPTSEAPDSEGEGVTPHPCCWFNRTDNIFGRFRRWRHHLPRIHCLPFWRWHAFDNVSVPVDNTSDLTTPTV
ncbi:hypothetical protein C0J52_01920 [Blattella germanica]|nr:hypothetical protein C0J52_01920 [Blattella germanica]